MKFDLAVLRDNLQEFNHSHKRNNSSLTMVSRLIKSLSVYNKFVSSANK